MDQSSSEPEQTIEQVVSPDSSTHGLSGVSRLSTPQLSASGQPIVPGFVLEAELGRGGMGVVYRAVQSGLNRTVALKMLLSGVYAGKMDIARFLGEAETVAAVKHPHVIQVYGYGEVDGRPYFAMELLTGGSLGQRLRERGPMTPTTAATLVAQLADGVEAAHELGIVHRDLKPDNILFDAQEIAKIVDFGLAKRDSHDLTGTNAIMGTPSYMAPEQAAGRTKHSGPSVDVYALGTILFEALTGRVPFKGHDVFALLEKIREENPPRVRDLVPGISRDLDQIVAKCLAKNPLDRYPSAGLLAEDLRRHLAGERPYASTRSALGGMWALLDRSRHAREFGEFATLFLWLAAIMLMGDVAMGLWFNGLVSMAVGQGLNMGRVLAVPLVVYWYAGRTAADGSASSRFLLALWFGYLAACMLIGIFDLLHGRPIEPTPRNYEMFSLLTGVAFIALGPNYWGWCYAFGIAFLLVPVLMCFFPLAAPFLFAVIWTTALVSVSFHLRRLSQEASQPI